MKKRHIGNNVNKTYMGEREIPLINIKEKSGQGAKRKTGKE